MKIEKATVSDLQEMLSLQKLAYKSEAEIYHDDSIPPMVQTIKQLQDDFKRQVFLKAVVDGIIIGSVKGFSRDGTCYVGRLMVHPDFQNRGIGKNLMNEIESLFPDCKRLELFTGNKSEKNLALYHKLGYKTFKTEKVNDQISLVYLEKIIR
ncbi:MAG: GNAT family N-acetyltransferase [Nitrosotalea sp.]